MWESNRLESNAAKGGLMATCNNCLHIEACKQWYPKLPDKYHDGCEHFMDKSGFDSLAKYNDISYLWKKAAKDGSVSRDELGIK